MLRSQDPDGVAQELYAYLITYQALRQLIHQTAVAADIDPDRLSFTTAVRVVRRFLTSAATATGQLLACIVDRAISQIAEDQHNRRDRSAGSRDELRAPTSAEFVGGEPGHEHGRAGHQGGWKAKHRERAGRQLVHQTRKQGRQRSLVGVAPRQMAPGLEEVQLVDVEAVARRQRHQHG